MVKMQPETDRVIDSIVARINHMLDAITITLPATSVSTTPSTPSVPSMPSPALSEITPDMSSCSTIATVAGPTSTPSAAVLASIAAQPTSSAPATPVLSLSRDAQVLRALVANATDLARQLACQRAIFTVHAPLKGAVYDARTMDDVGGEDDDALAGRQVRCVVFPGIIKRGDERGSQLHLENVVAKARVLVCPDEG